MQDVVKCPVCESKDWQEVGQRVYRAESHASEYLRKRQAVLFDLWQPGRSEFRATFIVCEQCGFCCYTPRPTEADLYAKYRYLNLYTCENKHVPPDSPAELKRAHDVHHLIAPMLGCRSRILDFGGGDGRLLRPFIDSAHDCFVVDYCRDLICGAKWLGNTLDEIQFDVRFDAIVCSHVIEHLADPLGTLIKLRSLLNEQGGAFVEVPMEIWRELPAREEPVTHINFFTRYSLRSLLERAGFSVITCRHEAYQHPAGHRATVVRALCRSSRSASALRYFGSESTQVMLNPRLKQRVSQAWIHRDMMLRTVVARFI